MPRPWPSSSVSPDRGRRCRRAATVEIFALRAVFTVLAAAAAAAAGERAATAATILSSSKTYTVQPDGGVNEHVQLAVRLDTANDLAAWSPYSIVLDENRKLLDLKASATQPDGKVIKVGRKDLDTAEVAQSYEIHSSAKLRTVEIPAVPPGSVFNLEYEVAERPYFPARSLSLGPERDRIERLRVEVRGAPAGGWRWRLDGSRDGLTVEES
ncbi:MAG TPA: DUF3857 domain-containing protein, partial [Thermoanaerobaculia bacterium]|nr:DUF3857 domain-containing protein [Thermoanaerobaculia bacterium]